MCRLLVHTPVNACVETILYDPRIIETRYPVNCKILTISFSFSHGIYRSIRLYYLALASSILSTEYQIVVCNATYWAAYMWQDDLRIRVWARALNRKRFYFSRARANSSRVFSRACRKARSLVPGFSGEIPRKWKISISRLTSGRVNLGCRHVGTWGFPRDTYRVSSSDFDCSGPMFDWLCLCSIYIWCNQDRCLINNLLKNLFGLGSSEVVD